MKKSLLAVVIIAFSLVMAACSDKKVDYADDSTANIDLGSDDNSIKYTYPDNPVEELKNYLESDAKERVLPIEISDIERVEGEWQNRIEFRIYFTDNPDNACVVSFAAKSNDATDDPYSLDGKDNPSFTIAFKDPDNTQDMISVLTSIIMYIAPDLELQEAEQLATLQDDTISIDGYSIPQDIGGYQVQAQYTNPHDYFTTEDFRAKLGVTIKSLKQIWGHDMNVNTCQELSSEEDLEVLYSPAALLEEDNTSRVVYAEFVVKDWWEHQEPLHGDPTTYVMVESLYGKEYELILDYISTPYEFGVGEKYTLFIYYRAGDATISYAIQYSEGV